LSKIFLLIFSMGTSKVTYNIPNYTGHITRSGKNPHAMRQSSRKVPRQGPLRNDMLQKM